MHIYSFLLFCNCRQFCYVFVFFFFFFQAEDGIRDAQESRGLGDVYKRQKEYTGAPYFAAMAAMRAGADLSFVYCDERASVPIKCYSPEIIVIPVTPPMGPEGLLREQSADIQSNVEQELSRVHALVVGPGLGRDPAMLDAARAVIRAARGLGLPLIIDADGLWLIAQNPDVINGYTKAVLTPNAREFEQLCTSCSVPSDLQALCWSLGNVTVLQKSKTDRVSDGTVIITCDEPGSRRRCGGQGDILAGTLATFMSWAHSQERSPDEPFSANLIAAVAASVVTRRSANLAFAQKQRATAAADILEEVATAMEEFFPTDDAMCNTPMHSPIPANNSTL
eukprot:TRINITY_DN21137_c0_g1_i1.p1 TRINITY_DN21137_c0_g1~~TRINITY_DN21137_c0_g1_i1.p1  ORF type:complete len:337 (+),score=82.27 TRINITY_DN21137_c0_g1_i1:55-1065(+)